MTYTNDVARIERFAAEFDELASKRAEGFSADETKSEELAVSGDVASDLYSFGSNGTNYGSYNDGTTVYVFGSVDSYVNLGENIYGTAVNIDASSASGINLLTGNSASNILWGGSYYNLLSGGTDYANDILVGGAGRDVFMYGKYEGSDTILNASILDAISLYDVGLSDIVACASDGNNIGIMFTTGNVLTVSCTSFISPDFVLADNSRYWYDCHSKTWNQSA